MKTRKCEIERLYKTHFAQMHRMATMFLHDDSLARDAVHDVFVSLLNSDSDVLPGVGYLMLSIRNRCVNLIRDAGVHERLHRLYLLDIDEYAGDDWPDEATLDAIRTVISDNLGQQCRRVVDMRFSAGLKYSEIAGALGISEVAVYKHLRHAIEIIRKTLSHE